MPRQALQFITITTTINNLTTLITIITINYNNYNCLREVINISYIYSFVYVTTRISFDTCLYTSRGYSNQLTKQYNLLLRVVTINHIINIYSITIAFDYML